MRLNDPLTTEIEFKDVIYPLDLSFDNVLDMFDVMKDNTLAYFERIEIALDLLIGENDLPIEEQLLLFSQIYSDYIKIGKQVKPMTDLKGNPMRRNKVSSEETNQEDPLIDIEQDAKYIYASFKQIGINLFEEQGKMSWEEFQSILESLPETTIMARIIKIRSWKPSKGTSNEEREQMKELQEHYQLNFNGGRILDG